MNMGNYIKIKKNKKEDLLFISLSTKRTLQNSIHSYILDFLKTKFNNIFVFCWGKRFYQKEENLYYFSGNLLNWFFYLKKIPRINYVYINDFFIGGLFGVIIKKLRKTKLLLRCGSPWKYQLNSLSSIIKTGIVALTKPLVIKNCNKVVYNSRAIVQRQYKHNWGVVYNGVNTKWFRPMKVKKISNKLNLIFIGNLNKEKGLDFLFAAVQNLTDKVNLTIVGDGPLLKEYIQRYPFAKFIGRQSHSELPKIINQHDVLVLPTFVESFPNVILEAMACGKPVIATNVFGIPEMVENGVNGFLIPPKNSKAIREAINNFIENKNLIKIMVNNVRKLMEEKFEKKKQLLNLYNVLLK
ncbi:MAG: glycosyltransferase family 4 protein [Nanoarchaeota archaeon]